METGETMYPDRTEVERLKEHLQDVALLRGKKGLSPLSKLILKTAHRLAETIEENAGFIDDFELQGGLFLELLEAMKVNCTSEEVEIIEIAKERFYWVFDEKHGGCPVYPANLNGDEVYCVWSCLEMSYDDIKAKGWLDYLTRLRRFGVHVL